MADNGLISNSTCQRNMHNIFTLPLLDTGEWNYSYACRGEKIKVLWHLGAVNADSAKQ